MREIQIKAVIDGEKIKPSKDIERQLKEGEIIISISVDEKYFTYIIELYE